MKKSLLISGIALGIAVLVISVVTRVSNEGKKGKSRMSEAEVAALSDGMYALFETDKGNINVELFYDKTPITVGSFVSLAQGKVGQDQKKGPFFDGLTFHRVVDGFVVQGGDPKGNGTGGPGYQIPDEIVDGLVFNKAGLLAMANAGPGTNGSQFFITLDQTPHLNGLHTIFGRVVSDADMKVVQSIKESDKIKKVSIVRKGEQAESFNEDFKNQMEKELEEKIKQTLPNPQKMPSGVLYEVKKTGSGNKPKKGDPVNVHYKGWLLTNGQVFDSSYERGEPIAFKVGTGQVIPGWDEVLLDMQVGEKRLAVLPPETAYGAYGAGGVIPPHAWLVFEMERVN